MIACTEVIGAQLLLLACRQHNHRAPVLSKKIVQSSEPVRPSGA
jgi:hypothetical protein